MGPADGPLRIAVLRPWPPAASRISAAAIAKGSQAGIRQCCAAFADEPPLRLVAEWLRRPSPTLAESRTVARCSPVGARFSARLCRESRRVVRARSVGWLKRCLALVDNRRTPVTGRTLWLVEPLRSVGADRLGVPCWLLGGAGGLPPLVGGTGEDPVDGVGEAVVLVGTVGVRVETGRVVVPVELGRVAVPVRVVRVAVPVGVVRVVVPVGMVAVEVGLVVVPVAVAVGVVVVPVAVVGVVAVVVVPVDVVVVTVGVVVVSAGTLVRAAAEFVSPRAAAPACTSTAVSQIPVATVAKPSRRRKCRGLRQSDPTGIGYPLGRRRHSRLPVSLSQLDGDLRVSASRDHPHRVRPAAAWRDRRSLRGSRARLPGAGRLGPRVPSRCSACRE